jgi:hypothetical protein
MSDQENVWELVFMLYLVVAFLAFHVIGWWRMPFADMYAQTIADGLLSS